MAGGIQRIENAAIAAAIVLGVVVLGLPWWALLAAFLLFDLSALGYLAGPRAGAVSYNAVHNYTGPALAAAGYLAARLAGAELWWLGLAAACWGFHVAVDRALGYGLKLASFTETHLGPIGRARRGGASEG